MRLCWMLCAVMLFSACHSKNEWAEIFIQKGKEYHAKKQYDDALNEYEKAKVIDPSRHDVHLLLADLYWEMGRRHSAYEQINMAEVTKQTLTAEHYYRRGLALMQELPRTSEIMAHGFDLAIKLEPDNPRWYEARALAYEEERKPELAQADWVKARQLRAQSPL